MIKDSWCHEDDKGNVIVADGPICDLVTVIFRGRNNRLEIRGGKRRKPLKVVFDRDGGTCVLLKNRFRGKIRLGEGCHVAIGAGVTCTGGCNVFAAEGASVEIGDDCMLASRNEIRADDGHPIYSVLTGERVNQSRSVSIGPHVWLATGAVVLSGSRIGAGSVIGYRSVVKGRVPNNCVAVGVPARVVRRNCVWERPHLTLRRPHGRGGVDNSVRSPYWNLTSESDD